MIELRSDTFTCPTPAMLEATRTAKLGNDGYREDPTVKALEALAAKTLKKEAALYVPSGTMGNLVSLLSHATGPSDLVIVGDSSDIYVYERKGFDLLSGVELLSLATEEDGRIDLSEIERAFQEAKDRQRHISVFCLENPHNMKGGRVLGLDYVAAVADFVHSRGAALHIDGARLFNAATFLKRDAGDLVEMADSVQFCLSKGLAAPIGSVVVGTCEFVERARGMRKCLGGTWRQAGMIAGAGIEALTNMVERLVEDHEVARVLGSGLTRIPGVILEPECIETNTVTFRLNDKRFSPRSFVETLWMKGVHFGTFDDGRIRAVVHYGVSRGDINFAIDAVASAISNGPIAAPNYHSFPDA